MRRKSAMQYALLRGVLAGAGGTVALNVATYADMALRGRPPSDAPAKLVEWLARRIGLAPPPSEGANQKRQQRESGLGALVGYGNGLGMGMAYGLLRSRIEAVPPSLAVLSVGLGAMAASDVPLVATGVSDPKTWSLSDWLADLIPHLIYGLVTVATYEAMAKRS